MTTVPLNPPGYQYCDNNGDPLNAGLVYTYTAGTATPKATYTDSTGNTPNANPVVLDSSGRASIWITGTYKIIVKTSAGVTISTDDNVPSFSSGTAGATFADGSLTIQNTSDATKQMVFSLASLTTGTTSTITIPNIGNFALAASNVSQTFSGAQIASATSLTSSASSIAINLAANNNFTHTLTENTTLANPSNIAANQSGRIYLTQHASSPKTLAFGSFYKFAGGITPALTATNSAIDVLYYDVLDSTHIACTLVKGFA